MAYFGITASKDGLRSALTARDVDGTLKRYISQLPPDAPIVILIHGYRYDPELASQNPHEMLFALDDTNASQKIRSWPAGLGFGHEFDDAGLCIGFGWPSIVPHLRSLVTTGRTGFAHVYERAHYYGVRLGELINLVYDIDPNRRVDIVAHSLGAKLALAALAHVRKSPGRLLLLGAAEYERKVIDYLDDAALRQMPEIYNFTGRFNDLFDTIFEVIAPGRLPGDRSIGLGLSQDLQNWVDVQLDRPDVTDWVNDRGIALRPETPRFCHWNFYTREGAFDVYKAILQRAPGWGVANLRSLDCFAAQDPRWARLRQGGFPALPGWSTTTSVDDLKSA